MLVRQLRLGGPAPSLILPPSRLDRAGILIGRSAPCELQVGSVAAASLDHVEDAALSTPGCGEAGLWKLDLPACSKAEVATITPLTWITRRPALAHD